MSKEFDYMEVEMKKSDVELLQNASDVALLAYNPDQPRDDHGRFGSGGGGGKKEKEKGNKKKKEKGSSAEASSGSAKAGVPHDPGVQKTVDKAEAVILALQSETEDYDAEAQTAADDGDEEGLTESTDAAQQNEIEVEELQASLAALNEMRVGSAEYHAQAKGIADSLKDYEDPH